MKQSELLAEVEELIEQAINANKTTPATWLVQEVLSRHSSIRGDDTDFALLCCAEHTRDTVRAVLRRFRPSPDEDKSPQFLLPGFKRVQRAYLIERDGEETIVPTNQITIPELRRKSADYRRMGVGCFEHADELDRLASERESVATA